MFDFECKENSNESLVIFFDHVEGGDERCSNLIERVLKKRNKHYDVIYILVPMFDKNEYISLWEGFGNFKSNLLRLHNEQEISLLSFDEYGKIAELVLNGDKHRSRQFDSAFFVSFGIAELLRNNLDNVFLGAPVGTVFKKPSGKTSEYFVKSSDMAVGSSQVRFVAFCMLVNRPKNIQLDTIWIDTSGISIYVEALILLISSFDGRRPKIGYRSFKSYGGYQECLPAFGDRIWIIISASLSNDMGDKIYDKLQRVSSDQILTLLAPKKESKCNGKVLFDISTLDIWKNISSSYRAGIELEIYGENFYIPCKDPDKLVIRVLDKPSSIGTFVQSINSSKSISVNRLRRGKKRNFDFDFLSFSDEGGIFFENYISWLNQVFLWGVPSSCKNIIFDKEDPCAKILLDNIISITGSSFNFYDYHDLDNLSKDEGVVAISPVISSGRIFSKLNSDLRMLKHVGMRVFISPFSMFESEVIYDQFKKSLCYGPNDFKYGFYDFSRAFVGPNNVGVWDDHLDILNSRSPNIWSKYIKILKDGFGTFESFGFLNKYSEDLFTPDFAFWSCKYNSEEINAGVVYLTISCILQKLRDNSLSYTKKNHSLFHDVNHYSVLDPENFLRFNDPLIQSSIWRSAKPHELNYSGSDDLSRRFVDIVIKLAEEEKKGRRNSLLDLLMALSLSIIKINEASANRLTERIKSYELDCRMINDLLDVILNGSFSGTDDIEF